MIRLAYDSNFKAGTQERVSVDRLGVPYLTQYRERAHRHDTCNLMDVPSISPAPEAEIAIGDCDDLLMAVAAKMHLTFGDTAGSEPATQSSSLSATVQSNMLECAQVLDQIHLTLAHEQLHRELLDLKVFDLQAKLAQSHAQLLGTQAGERRARALALHDSLTTLPNRNFFLQRLEHALALVAPQRGALAVLYLDLDGFKLINDIHGHAAGDELLRIVAARLKRAMREEDMVSRIGGDEFACLVAGSPSREQLSELARKLLDAVSADCKIGQTRLNVSLSIGIAICPDDGTTAETMLNIADTAMYRAKRGQAGFAFSDQVLDARAGRAGPK